LKEQLRVLIELQGYDARIKEQEATMRAIPEKLAPLRKDLQKLEAILSKEQEELDRTEDWRKKQEQQISDEEDGIRKAKLKVQASANARDYAAASRELENKRRAKSDREDEVLKVTEALEKNRALVTEHAADVGKLRDHVTEQEAELAARVEEIEAGLTDARQRREELAGSVEKKLLARYEYVLRRKHVALVPVEGRTCQGCHMNIPPQLANQLARLESVEPCPHCGRLMYHQTLLEQITGESAEAAE